MRSAIIKAKEDISPFKYNDEKKFRKELLDKILDIMKKNIKSLKGTKAE